MSKFSKILSTVTGLLGLKAPKVPAQPKVEIPAAPAPTARTDTGANIVIGTPTSQGRVSGSGSGKKKVDPLGALGLGGLNF